MERLEDNSLHLSGLRLSHLVLVGLRSFHSAKKQAAVHSVPTCQPSHISYPPHLCNQYSLSALASQVFLHFDDIIRFLTQLLTVSGTPDILNSPQMNERVQPASVWVLCEPPALRDHPAHRSMPPCSLIPSGTHTPRQQRSVLLH